MGYTEDEIAYMVRRVEDNQDYLLAALKLADNNAVFLPSEKIADTLDVLNQLFKQYSLCMEKYKNKCIDKKSHRD